MQHCVALLFYLATFAGFSEIISLNRTLNPQKEPAYKKVQFSSKWFTARERGEGIENAIEVKVSDEQGKDDGPFFKNEEYTWHKNIFRAESYAQSTLASVK